MSKPRTPRARPLRSPLLYLVLVLGGLWFFVSFATRSPESLEVPLSELESMAAKGDVANATFLERDQRIEGKLVTGEPYVTAYPQEYQDELANKLQEAGVPVSADAQKGSVFLNVILQILPFLLIFGFIIFLMQQGQGGGGRVMSFGKAKVRQVAKDEPKTSFEDVAGVDEAIEELQEVKEYLETPAKFQAMGAKVPKGVLLYGPPGTGKTLLARAVAGEAGVPFFSISGSDFVEMFVGVGAARVRDLFEQAKTNAPAIVFIDEIDAVGRHRGAGLGGGHDEREQTLNQLLVEMDGFDARTGVILMAATNRPDILDPALLRPGRFDRHVVIDRPDLEGRKGIMRVHARGKPLADTVDLDVVARRTPGFTGADLANVVNEAALLTARRAKDAVTMSELEEAIDRVIAGPERRTRVISDREKEITAYHEGGHAVVGHALPNVPPLHKVTIIPRGMAGGYTLALPTEDRIYQTRAELIDQLAFALAGRVAESLVFGDVTTGAGDDIRKATSLARRMVTEFGMSEQLGPLTLGQREHEVFLGRDFNAAPDYSDQLAFEIDTEVRRLIDEAHDEALDILSANRKKLDALATALIERETIEAEDLEAVLGTLKTKPSANGQRKKGAGVVVARRSERGRDSGKGKGGRLR
ncbi:MAG TPA: ATP-dependent zinc metalloprotease FtsH [Actinomycetota bacterium]|nr:ATP-dependent zinc metalloprotease FtsH [Actinomycetota bacterium]